ncbi:hypothetical protein SO802_018233 [Lithocarpus litseifolius]|uniref:Maturase K n=1 Tax=Lithocarpus litseifolius TaxID=425828 RepID=A0AAW2CK96_9ROSI
MGRSLFRKLLFDDSNEDEIVKEVVMDSTSQRKRRSYIICNHLAGHERLYLDYFTDSLVYPELVFWRRFQMICSLFLILFLKVEAHDLYFFQKRNGGKKLGLSSFQKITAALRMQQYVWIGETTALQSLKKSVTMVVDIFFEEYLRKPNNKTLLNC